MIVKNVRVTAYETEDLADFGGTFGGTTVEDDVYEFPQELLTGVGLPMTIRRSIR